MTKHIYQLDTKIWYSEDEDGMRYCEIRTLSDGSISVEVGIPDDFGDSFISSLTRFEVGELINMLQNQQKRWISIDDEMPHHGQKVLATYKNNYGKQRTVIANHLERWKEESNFEDYTTDEYSEEFDRYFYVEGWYEQIDNWGDFNFIHIYEGKITHWMPLPQPLNE